MSPRRRGSATRRRPYREFRRWERRTFDDRFPGPSADSVPLREPRPPRPGERLVLDFLLAGPQASARLRELAATARVVAECACGCPSIDLELDAPAASAPEIRAHSGGERDDCYAISARGRNRRGRAVEIHLTVPDTASLWLEIWPSFEGWYRAATDIPAADTLRLDAPPGADGSAAADR